MGYGSRISALTLAAFGLAAVALPANPLHLVSKQAKAFANEAAFPVDSPEATVDKAHNRITVGTVDDIHLTLKAGPEINMMSFEVDGLTNPEMVVPKGVRITLNVVNVDDDMIHNLYVTAQAPPYAQAPGLGTEAFGTPALKAHKSGPYAGAVLILTAATPGTAYYVCTVPGHAAKGMFGKITVKP